MTVIERVGVWVDVCELADLEPDRGACALIDGYQIAVFRLSGPGEQLYALSNYDPYSRAFVLSRGIVGSRGDVPKVSSPVFKQAFDLRTGQCLDDPAVSVMTFAIRTVGGRVLVGLP